jgi:putative ABC transport system substrate-binding protein
MPVIGFLYAGSPGLAPMAPFHQALAESRYVEGQNVTIEYRYAAGQYNKLPELAADLVRRQVSVIVATPNPVAPLAAKAATATIPIVFAVAIDPTKLGLVDSLNRPGGNATGVNYFISELVAKRMGVLHEFVPTAARFGVLINPNEPSSESFRKEVITAASTIGIHADFVEATDAKEIEAAFTTFVHNRDDALIVLPDTLFANLRTRRERPRSRRSAQKRDELAPPHVHESEDYTYRTVSGNTALCITADSGGRCRHAPFRPVV